MPKTAPLPRAPVAPHPLLRRVGAAVRARRLARRLTAEGLAAKAGLSRRFVAMVESGRGNISLTNFAGLCAALGVAPQEVLAESSPPAAQTRVVALLGLRGAGKSTLGPEAAKSAGARFVELDAVVERRAGLSLAEIFAVHGEEYFRRIEHEALRELVESGEKTVVATGGGIVASPDSMTLLRTRCVTVWLKATPEHHYARVAAQGDRRPFAVRVDARAALRSLLRARTPLYASADYVVDTSRLGLAAAQRKLDAAVRKALTG